MISACGVCAIIPDRPAITFCTLTVAALYVRAAAAHILALVRDDHVTQIHREGAGKDRFFKIGVASREDGFTKSSFCH